MTVTKKQYEGLKKKLETIQKQNREYKKQVNKKLRSTRIIKHKHSLTTPFLAGIFALLVLVTIFLAGQPLQEPIVSTVEAKDFVMLQYDVKVLEDDMDDLSERFDDYMLKSMELMLEMSSTLREASGNNEHIEIHFENIGNPTVTTTVSPTTSSHSEQSESSVSNSETHTHNSGDNDKHDDCNVHDGNKGHGNDCDKDDEDNGGK